jgi:hypothetical protein
MILGAGNQQGIQSKTNEQAIKLVRNSRKYQKGATGNNKKEEATGKSTSGRHAVYLAAPITGCRAS